ncbi:hypothetical protein COW36_12370 [bacterium (Candidatus Blackallbacteria) CG17_big_fil_post_rev_8_21_14_2_50_48_46]|uniref:Type II secretion system protein GspG C-terminal domain-containing protein n=1 Tax=bacterium (Candidatus Blackallbacteria) CG17_big_fil_post_rev_8_21_14_2_50_48_46 TaxID=2014261 RepID=A0A2M7G3W6_9BACT|nr:MAG: hypothetical protein COW64_02890 [bacterium (Candidatus Blackallbacteria) CG18_big_fil_WC_8_21_14_2_50_49_26]PIW16555.1 MAG: hypothetical protein COW36_12370 [bacterium (Candidatus Blackallbacteria) CG17_big_fil_post_rev_8_21_14_2_50_48_46]PIW46063.1 MAG: hypothetical protein COW20_17635 [bacterium (Candidatus Blackallbacteria) CG13_big_fil_rev_8_21_14_2_50_49_14]
MQIFQKPLLRNQSGFTLIELMVVIVILGILIAIALPNMISSQARAKVASTKTNMSTFRNMVEVYGVIYSAIYPDDVTALMTDIAMINEPAAKEFRNPFTNKMGKSNSYDDESATKTPGLVTYEILGTGSYAIYGYDQQANRIQHLGRDMVLSNG